jgi:MoxR-like ATPase
VAHNQLFNPHDTIHGSTTGETYVFNQDTILAINIALAAGRPLLVSGPPGSGKSSLAAAAARVLGWRYYEHRLSASSAPHELLYTFDMTRRGLDAQERRKGSAYLNNYNYLNPGPLWWAFDRKSAKRRGAPEGVEVLVEAIEPFSRQVHVRVDQGVVVLIDDVDRTSPELTEALLQVWASRSFHVEEVGLQVAAEGADRDLLILATGEERELSAALKRQCIVHTLSSPTMEKLLEIAVAHGFGDDTVRVHEVAAILVDRAQAAGWPGPSIGQFLDALRVTRNLALQPDTPEWYIAVLPQLALDEALANQFDHRPSIAGIGPPSRACRVFLCHSSGDKPDVRKLYRRLREEGFDAWLDEENILAGQDWNDEITTAVHAADLVIVCLSKASIGKTGYVQREIHMVLDLADEQPEGRIFLIPARLEECDVPSRLSRWQWVDLFSPDGYNRLFAAVWSAAQSLGLPPTAGELTARRRAERSG